MILSWRSIRGGLGTPAARILDPSPEFPGFAAGEDKFGGSKLAWSFLNQERPSADKVANPIGLLAAGQTRDVLDAGPGIWNLLDAYESGIGTASRLHFEVRMRFKTT